MGIEPKRGRGRPGAPPKMEMPVLRSTTMSYAEEPAEYVKCKAAMAQVRQGYLDRFVFQKLYGYAKKAIDRPGAELRAIIMSSAAITCGEILKKAMPIVLYEA